MHRRRKSILPEIRILAPSLERGLDDDSPKILELEETPNFSQTPNFSNSLNVSSLPKIYRSYEDDTDNDSSRYN